MAHKGYDVGSRFMCPSIPVDESTDDTDSTNATQDDVQLRMPVVIPDTPSTDADN